MLSCPPPPIPGLRPARDLGQPSKNVTFSAQEATACKQLCHTWEWLLDLQALPIRASRM